MFDAPTWMRRALRSVLGALAIALGAVSVLQAAPEAQAVLADSDAIRNPPKPFAVTVTLLEYRNAKQTDTNTLTVY